MDIGRSDASCVYLLACADGTFYCGWTNRLPARVATHNAGRGAKYTRSRRPVELVWFQICPSAQHARRLEVQVKRLSRAEKLALVSDQGTAR